MTVCPLPLQDIEFTRFGEQQLYSAPVKINNLEVNRGDTDNRGTKWSYHAESRGGSMVVIVPIRLNFYSAMNYYLFLKENILHF